MQEIKKKVYIEDWMRFHPYTKPDNVDFYFLKLCNEVNDILLDEKYVLWGEFYEDGLNIPTSCIIVSCFEDIVSDFGLWRAFTNQHKKMYGKYLPFFDLDEYYPEEINPQDISFLLWYVFSIRFKDEFMVLPDDRVLIVLAERIYDVLSNAYEYAPENNRLKEFKNIPKDETDFYNVRGKLDWLMLDSYLFSYLSEELTSFQIELLEKYKDEEDPSNLETYYNAFHNDYLLNAISNLLALKGKYWLAHLIGEDHLLFRPIIEMSDKKTGTFLYKSQDENNMIFEHIASGDIIALTKKSVNWNFEAEADKTVLFFGIVKWLDEWWFSGVLRMNRISDEIILEEKSNPENSNLFISLKEKKDAIKIQEKSFLKYFKDRLVFCKNVKELNSLTSKYFAFTIKEIIKLNPDAKNSDYKEPKVEKIEFDDPELNESPAVLFFNENSGMEILTDYDGLYHLILHSKKPDVINLDDIFEILSGEGISKEFIEYLIENSRIDFFSLIDGIEKNLYKDNFDFLLRFWKPIDYNSEPKITIIR